MKTRIISAVIALIIVIPLIIIGDTPFVVGVTILSIMGFYELMNLKNKEKKIPFVVKLLSLISFLFIVLYSTFNLVSCIANYKILAFIIFTLLTPIVFIDNFEKYNISDALFIIGSVFFLGIAFNYLIFLRNESLDYLIFLLLITIVTDTFAFITGRLVGKHKLSPLISPNKTWEGFVGGSIVGTTIASLFYISVFDASGKAALVFAVVLLLSIVGQIGDLVFSSIKRYYNIKDFSNIMPGHGGILDRLDSILFVILAFSFLSGIL